MPVDYSTLQRLVRPLPAHEWAKLVCPSCGYDVRQTLIDGFERCPECGASISVRACRPRSFDDSRWGVAFMFGVFALPSAMVLAMLVVRGFFGIRWPGWWFALGAVGASYAVVVPAYRFARLRMGERPSVMRSCFDGLMVVLFNVAILGAFVLLAL